MAANFFGEAAGHRHPEGPSPGPVEPRAVIMERS